MKHTLIAMAVVAAASALTAWTVNGWRMSARIESMKADHAIALVKATEAAAAETARMQKEKDDAIARAQQIAQRNADAASAAGRERDWLRDELTASRADFADSTHASLVIYADTLSVVLEQCVQEYLRVAAKADGHAADAQLLYSSWKAIVK